MTEHGGSLTRRAGTPGFARWVSAPTAPDVEYARQVGDPPRDDSTHSRTAFMPPVWHNCDTQVSHSAA
jgi:hypothetical protein